MKFDKTQEYLLLPKGIALTKEERQEINRIMDAGLREIYNVRKFYQGIVTLEGMDIRYEIISKAVNNRFLLKKIVSDERKEIITDITNKETLFDFVKDNITELLHPKGKYFKAVYSLLETLSYKGDKAENIAFSHIEEMGRKKGLQIQVLKPRKVEDDVYGGVDGFFIYNDREFTVQVKPLSGKMKPAIQEYKKDTNYFLVYVDGFIKDVYTDYLSVVNNYTNECFLYQAKGIIAAGTHYLIPKKNFVEV